MTGKLYGIGIGPGDPELLTLKAVRLIRESDVIMVPAVSPDKDCRDSVAYRIAVQAVPEMEEKECVAVLLPMTKDKEELARSHQKAAAQTADYLKQGKQIAFLNLGDVTVYASYLYVDRLVREQGYETELVNGIPSFCAAAARLGIGLAENSDQLHILSRPGQIKEGLKLPGTKVIMKMGRQIGAVKDQIRSAGLEVMMVENCGMSDERICATVDEIDEHAGYYSLMIVKEHK